MHDTRSLDIPQSFLHHVVFQLCFQRFTHRPKSYHCPPKSFCILFAKMNDSEGLRDVCLKEIIAYHLVRHSILNLSLNVIVWSDMT